MKFQADELTRRQLMAGAAKSLLGVGMLPFASQLAAAEATTGKPKRLICLYMLGAMSQLDTFDPKPDSDVQGDTGVIKTKIPGVQFGEHFGRLAKMTDKMVVCRSLSTETGAHEQGRYIMRTNYKPIATIKHPGFASWLHKQAGRIHKELPASVQIGGGEGPGYLGSAYAPVPIGNPTAGLQNTKFPEYLTDEHFDKRMELSAGFDRDFRARAKTNEVNGYDALYQEAIGLLRSKDLEAFDISKETEAKRAAYGESQFGQGCLLARRLIESGVRCVEVTSKSWDHHNNIFEVMPEKAGELDQALAALLTDLESSGLLSETMVVVMTEFGRKPQINANIGRDHHPAAFSCVLAGAGIAGGQVYGTTDEDAFHVEDDGMTAHDFYATMAKGLGLDPKEEIVAPNGRPFTMGNGGAAIKKLLA